jgi:diacylglycerol kinase family enzyme
MRGFVVINPRSGSSDQSEALQLQSEARRRRVHAHVLSHDDDVEALVREADAPALGVAGGDGSMAPVAAVAIERGLPFVCVPFGTRNHFARDLGRDTEDPAAALDAFDGVERRIDMGRVNGRAFVNNVSLGLYARLVHRRERHRKRRAYLASARAFGLALRERHPVPLELDGRPLEARVVLVANNDYDLTLFSLGERPRLDEGRLHLYTAAGVLPGRWHERAAEQFRVDSPAPALRAAVDGEPEELEPPLDFRIEAGALRVLVPAT